MRTLTACTVVWGLFAPVMATSTPPAQTAGPVAPAPAPATIATPEAIVKLWIERWNALDGTPASLDAFIALYTPDALHIAGPTVDQRGTATYRGHAGIRTMAAHVAAAQERRTYRLETETARETTAQLFHQTTGPWGGPAVAVQIVAVYTDHATQKRYATPGAIFLQLAGGRIHRARVYLGDGERAEVEPDPTRKRP
ncbi:MAG: nuclear transport factor 2 family protein [Acidobacteriota bacterium]